jgi:SAM-dependent methyltransferase
MLPNSFNSSSHFARRFTNELAKIPFRKPGMETIQRFERLHALTARAFGYEWNTYQTTSREEDIATFFWLTGVDPEIYQKLSITDIFTFYPTKEDIGRIDTSRLTGAIVLDVGCGMGKYLKVASEHAKHVIGLDLSDALLRAREIIKERHNVHLIQANILSPPIRTESIDFVYSLGVLHHTPDTHEAFLRSATLVRPGGNLAVWLYPKDPTTGTYAEWVHRIQDDFLRPMTCRMPPQLLRLFSAMLGRLTFVRDRAAARYRATGSRLAYWVAMGTGAVAVGQHRNPEIAAFLNFDWYSPQYRSYHTEEELAAWYLEAGFQPATLLPQRVSGIGNKLCF